MIKVVSRLASLMIVAGALVFFSNCGGDDPKPSREEQQLNKLKKEWSITGASLEGDATRINDFTNFKLNLSTITFNKNSPQGPYNYSVSGSRPVIGPWPASGQFDLIPGANGDTGTLVRKNDNIPMIYTISSTGQLTLEFNCSSCSYPPTGRTKEVNGQWVFTFN